MKVLILAGGKGMRLREAVSDRPKCMALIRGRPFLEYLIGQVRKAGMDDIVLSTGYMGDIVHEYFGDGRKWSVKISYSQENEPLGTAGAVRFGAPLLGGDDFMVMNGDSFLDADLRSLVRFHRRKKALVTMALARVVGTEPYGSVLVGKDQRITGFFEKSRRRGSDLVNGGIYCFNKRIFRWLKSGGAGSLEKDIFPKLVGRKFYGIASDAYFIDIGTPASYRRAKHDLAGRAAGPSRMKP